MKLTIIGASGHGKVVADIARLNGYDAIEFLDDDPSISTCGEYPVVGRTDKTIDGDVFVAIGNADIRERLSRDRNLITLIHPKAVIADGVEIGEGTVVMAGVVINAGARIGKGCIINTASSIDHDCSIGDFCHISVGAHLCGTVVVGNKTWIGAGATVINNVNICGRCMIGAGAVVIKDMVALRPKYNHVVKRIYAYETLSETGWDIPNTVNEFIPTVYEDISDTLEKKLAAMNIFQSQLADFPSARSLGAIEALAKYRGATVNVMAAEAFTLIREIKEK